MLFDEGMTFVVEVSMHEMISIIQQLVVSNEKANGHH
jgi:hypothetical protein